MVDVEEVILKRRSIRSYKDIPVEKELWGKLMTAATLAPNAGNLQPCKFIMVRDKKLISKIAHHCYEQSWINEAPLVIVVCADTDHIEKYYGKRGKELYAVQDAAAATENLILTAQSVGLSTCWIGAFHDDSIRKIMNIPERSRPLAIITVGYANEKVPTPPKHPMYRSVFLESYGNRIEDLNVVFGNVAALNKKRAHSLADFFRRIFDYFKR